MLNVVHLKSCKRVKLSHSYEHMRLEVVLPVESLYRLYDQPVELLPARIVTGSNSAINTQFACVRKGSFSIPDAQVLSDERGDHARSSPRTLDRDFSVYKHVIFRLSMNSAFTHVCFCFVSMVLCLTSVMRTRFLQNGQFSGL